MIEAVHTAIESESVHRLAETLFHFLWQGAVIYLGIWFLRRLNRNEIQGVITSAGTITSSPTARHLFHEDPRWGSRQSESEKCEILW